MSPCKLMRSDHLDFVGPMSPAPRRAPSGLLWVCELEDGSWSVFRGAKFRL